MPVGLLVGKLGVRSRQLGDVQRELIVSDTAQLELFGYHEAKTSAFRLEIARKGSDIALAPFAALLLGTGALLNLQQRQDMCKRWHVHFGTIAFWCTFKLAKNINM